MANSFLPFSILIELPPIYEDWLYLQRLEDARQADRKYHLDRYLKQGRNQPVWQYCALNWCTFDTFNYICEQTGEYGSDK